jgi:CheY-like chemotaxis protein
MVAKSTLTVRQVNPASFAPWARLTRNSSGESNPIGQSAHFSTHQPETDKQSSKSIAIVDDEDDLRSLFSRLVKGLGYHLACVANDGDEIVQLVLEDSIHPDLILMDYRMPTMNGMQAAGKILRVRPEIKIIIDTGDDSVRQDAISAGLFFMLKPFSISALAKTIEEAIGH